MCEVLVLIPNPTGILKRSANCDLLPNLLKGLRCQPGHRLPRQGPLRFLFQSAILPIGRDRGDQASIVADTAESCSIRNYEQRRRQVPLLATY